MDDDIFYKSGLIGVVPMDFYYPGKGKSGDLPPRKKLCKKNGMIKFLELMPNLELIILVGKYAQDYYLGNDKKREFNGNSV